MRIIARDWFTLVVGKDGRVRRVAEIRVAGSATVSEVRSREYIWRVSELETAAAAAAYAETFGCYTHLGRCLTVGNEGVSVGQVVEPNENAV